MKKAIGIIILGLLFCNIAFADCGLSKKLENEVHWSGNSAWRFEFFNHNNETIVVTKIHYYRTAPGVTSDPYRSYSVNVKVYGNSERSYVHSTNMNYDFVKSYRVVCSKVSSSSSSNKVFSTKKKESGFKWWYLLFIPVALFVIGIIVGETEKGSKSKATPTGVKKTKSKTTSGENFIEDVWEGRKPLGESFWLYYVVINGVISFGAGYLAEINDNNIFLIAAVASNIWAGVGTWNSSTNYQLAKIKKKQPHGWAYAAKVAIVLNFLTLGGQLILLFNT